MEPFHPRGRASKLFVLGRVLLRKDGSLPLEQAIGKPTDMAAVYTLTAIKALDDTEISCDVPRHMLHGCTTNLEFCLQAIKHARIASRISKTVSTMGNATYGVVEELDQQLRDWRQQVPLSLQRTESRTDASLNDATILNYLDSCFLASILQLHSAFHYPWSAAVYSHSGPSPSSTQHSNHIDHSTSKAAMAAREGILATSNVPLNADSLSS